MIEELEAEFVTTIPDELAPGVLYVSMGYATVVHLCACGCGFEVVLGLAPTDHRLSYDGAAVTLSPSVGNWSFACRSHYFIRSGRVIWAGAWDDAEVAAGRARDRRRKEAFFAPAPALPQGQEDLGEDAAGAGAGVRTGTARRGPWWRLLFSRGG